MAIEEQQRHSIGQNAHRSRDVLRSHAWPVGGGWWWQRLKENAALALQGRPHFPVHLILLEAWGGITGLSAYRRSVRRARQIQAKFDAANFDAANFNVPARAAA